MTNSADEVRYRPALLQSTAWRVSLAIRGTATLIFLIVTGVAFVEGRWTVGLLMIVLIVVSVASTGWRLRWAREGAIADRESVRGFASRDIPWRDVDHVRAVGRWNDVATLVLTDGTERRTRFPASYAQQLADLGGKPLR